MLNNFTYLTSLEKNWIFYREHTLKDNHFYCVADTISDGLVVCFYIKDLICLKLVRRCSLSWETLSPKQWVGACAVQPRPVTAPIPWRTLLTHYLTFPTLVTCVAHVGALFFQLPRRDICWQILPTFWQKSDFNQKNGKICKNYFFMGTEIK